MHSSDGVFNDGICNIFRNSQSRVIADRCGTTYDWPADLLRFFLTLLCGGCNNIATKRFNKTASITSIRKTQRTARFNVWSNQLGVIIVVSIMTQLLATNQADALAMHHRQLRKRHSIITDTPIVWKNSCGGRFSYSGTNTSQHGTIKRVSMNLLRKYVRDTYHTMKAQEQAIDTSDIEVWSKHKQTYKFLPKLRRSSSIALKRWHNNMQIYVAAVAYLYEAQHRFDQLQYVHESGISRELSNLLGDARSILCEIESTINRTSSASPDRRIELISSDAMFKRLTFRTKRPSVNDHHVHVDPIELKFVKYYLLEYVKKMWTIMRHHKPKNSSDINVSTSGGSSSVYSSSKSVNSLETNASRNRRIGGKRKRPMKRHRQRLINLNNLINSSSSNGINSGTIELLTT